jgi:NTP pyrophosphatase (non-canonical NTP hydrolase)
LIDGALVCPSCKGSGINPNKNIGELLMLIVSELSEALEAHRNKKFTCFNSVKNLNLNNMYPPGHKDSYFNTYDVYKKSFERDIKDTFEDEMADVILRIFDLCGYLNLDISKYVNESYPSTAEENIGQALFFINSEFVSFYRDQGKSTSVIFLAAALSRILHMCNYLKIDIWKHIEVKMLYNLTREHKHGKEY